MMVLVTTGLGPAAATLGSQAGVLPVDHQIVADIPVQPGHAYRRNLQSHLGHDLAGGASYGVPSDDRDSPPLAAR